MRWLVLCWSLMAVVAWTPSAVAQDAEEDVDRVALAARLIADGYWERASRVLSEVDEEDDDLRRARFYTLRGLVRSQEGLHEQAVTDYRLALQEEDADPLVNLQLAQSLLRLERAAEAIAAVDAAGEVGARLVGSWLLKSQAYRQQDDLLGAWVALTRGETWFPDELQFPRQKVFLLVEMQLYQQALLAGRALLERVPEDPGAWLAIAEAMRNAGEEDKAVLLLEEARLRFPTSVPVATQLARVYLKKERPGAAADILRVAAEVDDKLFAAASEAYRQSGQMRRALYMNGRVPDPKEKARQRLGLYIEQGDWARASALESRLSRLELLSDDSLRYGLAYAWFQLGDMARAESFLKGITDSAVFRDATVLRGVMQSCADAGWSCP